jgi:predicted 3-demethylubiquinone-9 3-methyltransferase (glyoxalase superfamily)
MQKITPFLWFNNNVEDAMNFYVSVFKNSKIISVQRQGPNGPVFTATIELDGQRFHLLNGGPQFPFTEAISLFVDCEDQKEVDELWAKLTADGGSESRCGWLKDKFGLSWQIIPKALMQYLRDPDPVKAKRAMDAMLTMGKIDVEGLKRAHEGR